MRETALQWEFKEEEEIGRGLKEAGVSPEGEVPVRAGLIERRASLDFRLEVASGGAEK